jgi:hypothetical protein
MKRILLTLGLIAAGATAAHAYHPSGNGIDRRQGHQERRIEHGLRDGSLTGHEYRRLKQEQQRIEALERRAKRDGVITPYERQQIRGAQRDASRHIYHEQHDGQHRGWRRWVRWWPSAFYGSH